MKFKFEKLIIWHRAMDFGEKISVLSESFPKKEMFNLTSQICRAVDSIALNISEGAIGQTPAEFRRFLAYAIRSVSEVATCLHKANRRSYVTPELFDENYNEAYNLMNMIVAFRKTVK